MKGRRSDPPLNRKRLAAGRFDWERAVIGVSGPRSPTTRLVLLVIASYVERGCQFAWPSISSLQRCTGLSKQSVIDQLEAAVAEGWIQREFTRLERMRYRGNVYWLSIPTSTARLPVKDSPSGQAGVPVTGQRRGATSQRRTAQLVNVAQRTNMWNRELNIFKNINDRKPENQKPGINPENRTEKLNPEAGRAKDGPTNVAEWAAELGIVKVVGEHPGAFQARVFDAVQRHKAAAGKKVT